MKAKEEERIAAHARRTGTAGTGVGRETCDHRVNISDEIR